MCDVVVLADTSWARWYPCERKGKYELTVNEEYGERAFTVSVCGQHKNMLGTGQRMMIRTADRKEVSVRGQEDERGRLKNEMHQAQRLLTDAENELKWKRDIVGQQAVFATGELLNALEDHDHEGSPLFNFVKALKQYQKLEDAKADYFEKTRQATLAYEKYVRG